MNEQFAKQLGLGDPNGTVPRPGFMAWCLSDRLPAGLGLSERFPDLEGRFPAWLDIRVGPEQSEAQLILLIGNQPNGLAGVSEGLSDEVTLWLVPRVNLRWLLFSALARQRWEWSEAQPIEPCPNGPFEARIDLVSDEASRSWSVARAPSDRSYMVTSTKSTGAGESLVGPREMWTFVGEIVDLAEMASGIADAQPGYQAGSA